MNKVDRQWSVDETAKDGRQERSELHVVLP